MKPVKPILFILLLLIISTSCKVQKENEDFKKRYFTYKIMNGQEIRVYHLKESKIIQNFPVQAGRVHFHEEGWLYKFNLQHQTNIQGYQVDGWTILDSAGQLSMFNVGNI